MGVLNITPDSFSDGGLWLDPTKAIDRGLEMLRQGAQLLDLGAESSRPGGGVYGHGAEDLSTEEELARLLPVLEGLRGATDAPLCIDTRKGPVAAQALAAGGDLVNDVSLLADPDLGRAVADSGCPLVLMHSRGAIATMQREIRFDDVVAEVREELNEGIERAVELGVERSQIVVDPGIGFGKTYTQNLQLIRSLNQLAPPAHPVLLGASRKSFIGHFGAAEGQSVPPPQKRLGGSLAAVGWAASLGAAMVRVHDVQETVQFLRVWEAIKGTEETS